MTFGEALATQPQWVQIWVAWLSLVLIVTPIVLVFWRKTWVDAAILAVSLVVMFAFMQWLYGEVGFVRLLGLPHVVVWTPLAFYVWTRIRSKETPGIPKAALTIFLISIVISLGFDYVDVARWLLGERGSMIPES